MRVIKCFAIVKLTLIDTLQSFDFKSIQNGKIFFFKFQTYDIKENELFRCRVDYQETPSVSSNIHLTTIGKIMPYH